MEFYKTKLCHVHAGVDKDLLLEEIKKYISSNAVEPEYTEDLWRWAEKRRVFYYAQSQRRLIRCVELPKGVKPSWKYRGYRGYSSPVISYSQARELGLLRYTRRVMVVFSWSIDDDGDDQLTIITAYPVGSERATKEPGNFCLDETESHAYKIAKDFWRSHALIEESGEKYREALEEPDWYVKRKKRVEKLERRKELWIQKQLSKSKAIIKEAAYEEEEM